ncbi:hypothetical protein V1264_001527 [Littorina saxatilis]|uniref:Uncharacterized protein n=1 Tax=Littorina saxatilis TaxID=31220 RepID=A0AAN9BZM7_9CAEN
MGGPAWTMVKKALRVRRKMFALARTKENTLRELAGYPPLKSWWENCYGGCMATFRVTICRGFCPCFVGRFRFKSFFCPRTTCCGRCFYEGDYENEVLKNFLGFLLGVVLTVLFYAWLCLQKDYPKLQAAIISCVVGVPLTLGMAFAKTVRCLVFLTLPSMFSKKGRNMLVIYATVLVFTYPATNVATNLKIMTDSSTCGQSLMMNETSQLMALATDPLAAAVDALEEMYRNIKAFSNALMAAFKVLIRAVKEVVAAVQAVS